MGPGQLIIQSVLVLTPTPGSPDSGSQIGLSLDVEQTLSGSSEFFYTLTNATPQAVSFAGLAQLTALRVTVDASVIDLVITTADGANQIVPIDASGKFEWACISKPITALTLVGQANQTIHVKGWMGTI